MVDALYMKIVYIECIYILSYIYLYINHLIMHSNEKSMTM